MAGGPPLLASLSAGSVFSFSSPPTTCADATSCTWLDNLVPDSGAWCIMPLTPCGTAKQPTTTHVCLYLRGGNSAISTWPKGVHAHQASDPVACCPIGPSLSACLLVTDMGGGYEHALKPRPPPSLGSGSWHIRAWVLPPASRFVSRSSSQTSLLSSFSPSFCEACRQGTPFLPFHSLSRLALLRFQDSLHHQTSLARRSDTSFTTTLHDTTPHSIFLPGPCGFPGKQP